MYESSYGVPIKKQSKIKLERRRDNSQDGILKDSLEKDDDHDSELENGANHQMAGKTKKQQQQKNPTKSGKLKVMKPKRGGNRKYKVLKDKNQDGNPVQSKYKRKKLLPVSAGPLPSSPTTITTNELSTSGNLETSQPSITSSIPSPATTSKRQVKTKERKIEGKTTKTTKKNKSSNNETITSDEDEVCSVSNCARPSGKIKLVD